QPLRIGLHVDHRHRPAELKLRDQLEQERGCRFALPMELILANRLIQREVTVRGGARMTVSTTRRTTIKSPIGGHRGSADSGEARCRRATLLGSQSVSCSA